jgi:sugar phosphate isomerase/epimerase
MCAETGAQIVAFHGARTFFNIEPMVYFERFWRISLAARRAGVMMCQENVSLFFGGDVRFIKAMRMALPEVNFLLDIKQAVRAGIDPFDMIDAMGPKVRHVHASDNNDKRDCMLPGAGEFDFIGCANAS